MKIFFVPPFLLASIVADGQLIGKYDTQNESHTNRMHFEELVLNADSTFSYFTRMEFIRISKEGKWFANKDTLFLSETKPCCKEKIVVEERSNKQLPKNDVRFSVTSLQGENINYHLIITNRDSTKTIWSRNGITEVKIKELKKFQFIINSLVCSPEYRVKSSRSNEFKVRLAPNRFFYNEKWLIRNGTIVPIGWDNKYVGYYLKKQ